MNTPSDTRPLPGSPDAGGPASLDGTALVLGGGGALGNAWLIGVLAGLADGGADPTGADRIIGTSAGATAAAQITSEDLGVLYSQTVAPVPQHATRAGNAWAGAGRVAASGRPIPVDHLARTQAVIDAASDLADMRRRAGASALALPESSDPEAQARWRATVAARLPRPEWPDRRILLTAVDARTGEGVVLERDHGVELVDAVAASTAGGFAYAVGDRMLIDGGYRTNAENADLATGCERVLVLSPFGGRTRFPLAWRTHLAPQVDALRAAGSAVEVIGPDEASIAAFGDNMMNARARPDAARAGFAQGRTEAARLRAAAG